MIADPHVLIADDHALFRQGLRYALLDSIPRVRITEVETFDQAFAAIAQHPDFTLASFDLQMPGMDSGRALLSVRRLHPNLPLVVLSGHEERHHVLAALEFGASGFIPKSLSADAIVTAMRHVMGGNIYIPPSITMVHAEAPPSIPALAFDTMPAPVGAALTFTPRQLDVLNRLLAGRSTKEIGRDLELAEGTVKIHLAALFRALRARNRVEAVANAISLGLTEDRQAPR